MEYLHSSTIQFFIYLLFEDSNVQLCSVMDKIAFDFITHDIFGYKLEDIVFAYNEKKPDKILPLTRIFWEGNDFEKDFYSIYLKLKNRKKLEKFIKNYIEEFERNELIARENHYSYYKHLELISEVWGKDFDNFGHNISISTYTQDKRHKSNFRVYEIILSLQKTGMVGINKCYFQEHIIPCPFNSNFSRPLEPNFFLYVNVGFKKTPYEISDTHKYWLYYGDIRVNKNDNIAYYKTTRFPAVSTKGKAFSLLCLLVKNGGKKTLIDAIFNEISPDEKELDFNTKKNRLEDWLKEIRKNLGINEDKKPSITLTTTGKSAILVSNPPVK